jgi:hypothetical protein
MNSFKYNFQKIWNDKCSKYSYIPDILPPVNRIIVLGDIHGDYNKMIEMLKIGKVIDSNNNWIGGETVVVQVGDQIDSCRSDGSFHCHQPQTNDDDNDVEILYFMTELHKKAQEFGGAVYSIMGNHELMNVQGDFSYVSHNNYINFRHGNYTGKEGRYNAFQPGNDIASFLACTRKMALIIGSNLFVHAGIIDSISSKYNITDLNQILTKYLLGMNIEGVEFNDLLTPHKQSPMWNRTLANGDCSGLLKTLSSYNVGRLYVGHTPQLTKGIESKCGKKLWLTDIGVSKAFKKFGGNSIVQVLEITNDKTIKILK